MKAITLAIVTIFSLAFTPLVAQDFQKGFAAYNSGDYSTAVEEWTPLANQGDAGAQTSLARMYENGQGVPQDYVIAHMWYNIANAEVSLLGAISRDAVAEKMTSADISKAQAMARECMSSGYTKCGY